MSFNLNLPLKLSVAFSGWGESADKFLTLLKKVEKLPLFSLSLELDREAFFLLWELKDKLSFKAFRKVLVIEPDLLNDDDAVFNLFNETEISLPFYIDELSLERLFEQHTDDIKAISFLLTRTNIPIFKKILNLAQERHIKINIPNPNLIRFRSELSRICLRYEDLNNLCELKDLVKAVKIEVHDYFLARFFGLADAEKFQGCQAGKLLGHVENAILYPCSSIPIPLGSLVDNDFEFLWKEAYNIVMKLKNDCCRNCSKMEICKLGCIGNAVYLGDYKDPLCEA